MNIFRETIKMAISPTWWALEKILDNRNKPQKPVKNAGSCNIPIYTDNEMEKMRDAQFKEAEEAPVIAHEVVNAIHLKPGDIIIHKYSKFKITECGRGFGSGNEFGNYFWIKGQNLSPFAQTTKEDFWSFQKCPMIRLIGQPSEKV